MVAHRIRDAAGRDRMKAFVTAAIIAFGTTAAFGQAMNLLGGSGKMITEEEVKAQEERDSAYKSAISKMPAHKPASDPWGNVRGTNAPTNQSGARSGAK
jgi:hypothetical protein